MSLWSDEHAEAFEGESVFDVAKLWNVSVDVAFDLVESGRSESK